MKKLGIILAGVLASLVCVAVAPKTVSAMGMPCTETEMAKAQAMIAAANQQIAVCEAAKQAAEANYNLVAASNATELEKLVAYNDFVNKTNQLAYSIFWKGECEKYYNNAYSRGWSEQYQLDMQGKWANRATVDTLKQAAVNKQDIANQALNQLNNLKSALQVQSQAAATNTGLCDVVNQLTAQVAQAEADYQAKAQAAQAAAIEAQNAVNNLNWATNDDNAAYNSYVNTCIKAVGGNATDHNIMHWFD